MFKVNDRVRVVPGRDWSFTAFRIHNGQIGTITQIFSYDDIKVKYDDKNFHTDVYLSMRHIVHLTPQPTKQLQFRFMEE